MFTKYDKAAAAAMGAALTTIIGVIWPMDPQALAAVAVLITGFLTWAVPNKGT